MLKIYGKLTAVILCIAVLLLVSGCGKKKTAPKNDTSSAVTSSWEESSSGADLPHIDVKMFKRGIWAATEDGLTIDGIYYFSDNGKECSYHDYETENGVPFDYEMNKQVFTFHFGGAEDESKANVTYETEDAVYLEWWAGSRTEKLHYVSDTTYDKLDKSTVTEEILK